MIEQLLALGLGFLLGASSMYLLGEALNGRRPPS